MKKKILSMLKKITNLFSSFLVSLLLDIKHVPYLLIIIIFNIFFLVTHKSTYASIPFLVFQPNVIDLYCQYQKHVLHLFGQGGEPFRLIYSKKDFFSPQSLDFHLIFFWSFSAWVKIEEENGKWKKGKIENFCCSL